LLVQNQRRLQAEVQRLREGNEILRVCAGLQSREAEKVGRVDPTRPLAGGKSETDPRMLLPSLRAEQSITASFGASSSDTLDAARASFFMDQSLSNPMSITSFLPVDSLLEDALSSHLANRRGESFHLPSRTTCDNFLLRQQLLERLGGSTVSESFEGRPGRPQIHASLRDHDVGATAGIQSVPTLDGLDRSETERLLEFLWQRVSGTPSESILRRQPSDSRGINNTFDPETQYRYSLCLVKTVTNRLKTNDNGHSYILTIQSNRSQ